MLPSTSNLGLNLWFDTFKGMPPMDGTIEAFHAGNFGDVDLGE